MKALILAAGYATRLYPLTKEFPKPLLLVKKRPIIDYIIDKLQALKEVDEIIVVTNSKFISLFRKWKAKLDTRKPISLVDDITKTHSDKRGAIGDMDFAIAKKRIRDNLLVIGGDNLFEGDLKKFVSFIKTKAPSPVIGVYDIKYKNRARHYGIVKLDARNRVIDFKEKPKMPHSTLVAMCLYYFPKERLSLIRDYLSDRGNKNDATGFYIDWLRKKVPIYGFIFGRLWYDIGHHELYNEAQEKFLK
jgi:glucose-1-phosphate thymidylyltransferase